MEKENKSPETPFSNRAPQPNIQAMILFFRPPLKAGIPNQAIDFLQETATFEAKFDSTIKNAITNPIMAANMSLASACMAEGYEKSEMKTRRTGEPTYLHSLRVFLRGLSELPNIDSASTSIFHVSLLARILHDAQEDFKGYKIDEVSGAPDTYSIHLGDTKWGYSYKLTLTPNEKKLLDMQVNALSAPENTEKNRKTDNTHLQMAHLMTETRKIYDVFGPLAAYLTLRAKIDDRIDNVFTYYETEHPSSKNEKMAKLTETLLHFHNIENQALRYRNEYIKDSKELSYLFSVRQDTTTETCFNLIKKGGYDALLQPMIDSYIQRKSNEDFLIPGH